MPKFRNYSESIGLVVFSFFIFILLPFIKAEFTIDADLAPKYFITSVFVFVFSSYVFFLKKKHIEINGSIRHIIFVVILILLWMSISLTFSINKGDAFSEFSRIALLYSILFILYILFLQSNNSLEIISRASAFAVLIFLLIAAIQLYTPLIDFLEGRSFFISNMVTSSLANKNFFSEVLVLFLPLLIIGALNDNYLWRTIFKVVICFNLSTIILLQTLAAWVAIVISVILFLILAIKFKVRIFNFQIPRKFKFVILIILVFLLSGSFFFYIQTSSYKELSTKISKGVEYISNPSLLSLTREENNNSVFERLVIWRNSFRMISDYPLMGIGLNNWKLYNSAYGIGGTQFINSGYVNYEHPHNDYLLIWAEQGPVGIVFYLLFFFLIIREGIKLLKKPDTKSKVSIILLLIGVFGFMTLSMFAYPRSRFYSMILLMIFFALIITQNSETKKISISIKPLALAMFTISVFGAVASYYRIIGEIHTKKVQIFQLRQDFSRMIREADKAYSWFYPLDLTSTPLSWYKGMAYYDSGLLKDTIHEYEKAIEVNPNHLRLLNDIATSYERNNQKDQAIYYYRKVLGISPLFLEANLNISATYFNINNIDSAFYFIDKIYSSSIQMNDVLNYKEFLEAILYAKSLEIIKAERDSLSVDRMMLLVTNKSSLRQIYDKSKAENQPFAKYLLNYSKPIKN